ncbi:hypothetical protein [Priestia endophytica]|uniref:hypothetical protein n=1 Tax=Priestia endophytica TaxID=135735 RepID=UPI00227DC056|nr:hypothetical protein [Priestia endophytica]MCY8235454.1 hypothetical protein [Priestia endophytica]
MFKRKLLTALITSILSIVIISFLTPIDGFFGQVDNYLKSVLHSFLIFPVYIIPCVFLYGLPTSLLIGFVTNRMEAGQFQFSLVGHTLFGILPFFLLWFFTFYSVGIALLFCVVDHILQCKRS